MGNHDLVEALASVQQQMEQHAQALSLDRLMAAIDAFNEAALESRATWQPKLPLEIALVTALEVGGQPKTPPSADHRAGKEAASIEAPAQAQSEDPVDAAEDQGSEGDGEQGATRPDPAKQKDDPEPSGVSTASLGPIPEGELTFQAVLDRWDQILAAAFKRDPRCQALLNSGRPMGLRRGKIVLGFASDILRDKMQKEDNLAVVTAALESTLGQEIGVRCVLASAWDDQASPGEQPPVEEGGMVATALRDLGAEVAEVRPSEEDGED
jgi:DNA polymerase-3 subunit gamma/tau